MTGDALDYVLAAHGIDDPGLRQARFFNPDPQVYELAVRHCGVATNAICCVSASTWDAQAAAHFGFQVTRVDRFGLKDGRLPGAPKALVKSLTPRRPQLNAGAVAGDGERAAA